MKSDRRRTIVKKLQVSYEVSERRALLATGFPRASHRYQSVRDDRADLRMKLRDLAASRVHYGYRRLHPSPKRRLDRQSQACLSDLQRGRIDDASQTASSQSQLSDSGMPD